MEQKYEDVFRLIAGPIAPSEGRKLYELAKQVKDSVIVEIGSLKGTSAMCLGAGSKEGHKAPVYSIDPAPHGVFGEHMKQAEVEVEQVLAYSEGAAKIFDKPVGLIFIDGDHEYGAVRVDYEVWRPKMIKGGIMAFHDVPSHPGPTKVMQDAFGDKNWEQVDCLAYKQV